jgi:hypothetical protein
MRYPADPPRVEEIIAVMRQAGDGIHGGRVRSSCCGGQVCGSTKR